MLKEPEVGKEAVSKAALLPKLSLCWTGPYKILFVGPGKTDEGLEVGKNLLLVEVKTDEQGSSIMPRVSVHRCKKCYRS